MSTPPGAAPAASRPRRGGNVFTQKIGPLPMWVWLVMAAGLLLGWAFLDAKKKQSAAATSTAAQTATETGAAQVPQFVNQTYTTVQAPSAPAPPAGGHGKWGTMPPTTPPTTPQSATPQPGTGNTSPASGSTGSPYGPGGVGTGAGYSLLNFASNPFTTARLAGQSASSVAARAKAAGYIVYNIVGNPSGKVTSITPFQSASGQKYVSISTEGTPPAGA